MQLTYRGINYQRKTSKICKFDTLNTDNIQYSLKQQGFSLGKYRGALFCIPAKAILIRKILLAYKYRGVDYIKHNIKVDDFFINSDR